MKMKRLNSLLMLAAVACAAFSRPVFAEEGSFLQRIFFDDFISLGAAACHEPLKTGIIAGGLTLATAAVFFNDLAISEAMKQKNAFNDVFFGAANMLGDGVYVLAADAFLFLGGDKEKRAARLVIESLLVSGAVSQAVKLSTGRKRPSDEGPYVFMPFSAFDMSMPSGHASTAFAWATVIGDTYDIGWLTYPLAALCGWARVYRNAHWPSDVLAGAALGIFTAKAIMAAEALPESRAFAAFRISESGQAYACLNIRM